MAEHDRLPMPFERARTQLLLGQLSVDNVARRTPASATLQRGARHLRATRAPRCGPTGPAPSWPAPTSAPSATAELTPSEQRVAELAAAGHDQPRRRRRHCSSARRPSRPTSARIYRKLDIHSRMELYRAFERTSTQTVGRSLILAVARIVNLILLDVTEAALPSASSSSGTGSRRGPAPIGVGRRRERLSEGAASTSAAGAHIRLLMALTIPTDDYSIGVFAADSADTVAQVCARGGRAPRPHQRRSRWRRLGFTDRLHAADPVAMATHGSVRVS